MRSNQGGLMFPQLTAAIADIAAFMGDDEDSNFDAARPNEPQPSVRRIQS
jgi:hypothetical protein